MISEKKPLFSLGQTVATPGALESLTDAETEAADLLKRHVHGDWGDLSAEDADANNDALKDGSRLLSAYVLNTGVKIWVITEAVGDNDLRASTTVLLPDEY